MNSSNKIKKLNDTMVALIDELSDQQYHDGTSLGLKLNMSRAAVWKYIQKLIEYGIQIDSVKGRGYILAESIQLLSKQRIESRFKRKNICCEILEQVDSTNNYLKQHLSNIKLAHIEKSKKEKKQKKQKKNKCVPSSFTGHDIAVCIAESQTQGRGRMQREWHSPFAKNIYLSFLYSFQKDITELAGLSLVIGLAAARVIGTYCKDDNLVYVKWPNDIMIDHKKMAGILIDLQAEAHGGSHIIVGIGINVNMTYDAYKGESNSKGKRAKKEKLIPIDRPWCSLYQVTGEFYDRNLICSDVVNSCIEYLELFSEHGFEYFKQEWRKRDYLHKQSIDLVSQNKTFSGLGSGIDSHGRLLITINESGNKRKLAFSSGDTRIIKY